MNHAYSFLLHIILATTYTVSIFFLSLFLQITNFCALKSCQTLEITKK